MYLLGGWGVVMLSDVWRSRDGKNWEMVGGPLVVALIAIILIYHVLYRNIVVAIIAIFLIHYVLYRGFFFFCSSNNCYIFNLLGRSNSRLFFNLLCII